VKLAVEAMSDSVQAWTRRRDLHVGMRSVTGSRSSSRSCSSSIQKPLFVVPHGGRWLPLTCLLSHGSVPFFVVIL
jgi:hypothetical protein